MVRDGSKLYQSQQRLAPLVALVLPSDECPSGSYGTAPLPVLEAVHEIEKEIESNPDLFMKVKLKGRLDAVRHRLANL
jgi:hypothetical protein